MMNNLLHVLIEVSSVFALQYLFYLIFLSRLTFHHINRGVLLSILVFSIVIPSINIVNLPLMSGQFTVPDFTAGSFLPDGNNAANTELVTGISPGSIFIAIYLAGVVVFLYRLFASAFRLILLIKKATTCSHDKYVITTQKPFAFSCFKYLFIPPAYSGKNREVIIWHEKMHAKYFHTIDLILTELFIAFLWFHPFVYFFRKSIRAVHEFQVDDSIVARGISRRNYLELMLHNLDAMGQPVGFYNYFNGITLKKRIKMITQEKSDKKQKLKYFLLLPVMAILIMSFGVQNFEKPDFFPLEKGSYDKITSTHGKVFKNPFTDKMVTHMGLDISAPEGTKIFAAGAGRVLKVSTEEGWGNLLIIDHGNGYETWYAHLERANVIEGAMVKRGQVVANVGNTGYSTGPHLHFEVRVNGERLNPLDFVKQ